LFLDALRSHLSNMCKYNMADKFKNFPTQTTNLIPTECSITTKSSTKVTLELSTPVESHCNETNALTNNDSTVDYTETNEIINHAITGDITPNQANITVDISMTDKVQQDSLSNDATTAMRSENSRPPRNMKREFSSVSPAHTQEKRSWKKRKRNQVELVHLITDVAAEVREHSGYTVYINYCYRPDKHVMLSF